MQALKADEGRDIPMTAADFAKWESRALDTGAVDKIGGTANRVGLAKLLGMSRSGYYAMIDDIIETGRIDRRTALAMKAIVFGLRPWGVN
jgi:hypothetical protein